MFLLLCTNPLLAKKAIVSLALTLMCFRVTSCRLRLGLLQLGYKIGRSA
jgi:hypothetical protein